MEKIRQLLKSIVFFIVESYANFDSFCFSNKIKLEFLKQARRTHEKKKKKNIYVFLEERGAPFAKNN